MIRFVCNFEHPDTGERRNIDVEIANDLYAGDEHREVKRQAAALRSAYALVPRGFLHSSPPKQLFVS